MSLLKFLYNTDIGNVYYVYYEPNENSPAEIQISTVELSQSGISLINTESFYKLFAGIPIAQACNRGFTIYVGNISSNQSESEQFIATKKLNDSREINITKNKECSSKNSAGINAQPISEMMNDLEQHLIQIQSY